ncbi:hypothetical protein ACTMU2_14080 [Cupriavidus basilensis]
MIITENYNSELGTKFLRLSIREIGEVNSRLIAVLYNPPSELVATP